MNSVIIDLIIITILLIMSGLFSAAETALLSFKNMELEEIKEKNLKLHNALRYWLKNPSDILSTILISNNAINILATAIATDFVSRNYGRYGSIAIATFVVTIAILVFGEVTPKLIAKNYSSQVSTIVIRPLIFFSKLFYPIVFILTHFSKLIGRILGLNIVDKEITVTEKDIKSLIFVGSEEGIIDETRKEMLDGIFSFNDLTAADLVIPRQNVFMLKSSDKIGDVIVSIMDKGYSRIPIYEEDIDNIIGAVYIKDLMPYLYKGFLDLPLKKVMRDINFVPETKSVFSILKEFKEKKIHIAVVIDEYGGTVGVMTIEDILEVLVGDIKDEHDKENIDIKLLEQNKYLIRGDVDIEEINKKTSLSIPENDEYESLGGFITYIMGKVPEKSEIVSWQNLEIMIKEVSNHAVRYAIVSKIENFKEEQNED